MFYHAYNSYLENAYPYDELRPLTCDGQDTWGRYELIAETHSRNISILPKKKKKDSTLPQCSQTVGKQCFNNFGLCQVVKNIKTCKYMNMHGQQTRQKLTNENTLYSPKINKKIYQI